MQPPPMRKGPYLKTLKHVHTEQVARLQAKNQHECDLLEDIRSFTKQRSAIEKSYADALLKISNAYLNKKIPSIPDLRDDDGDEQWNVWNVWRTVLEENEKLAKARLAAVEVFQQQITDDAKTIRQLKLAACKKYLDQLQVIQKEVQYSVAELDRNKKLYFEEEHLAHDVRDKARDVEEKLKKKKGSIFSTLTALKRESVKVSSKKEVCEEKSTGARNEYLLALAIANAHQDHYYNVDLDGTLRNLEADVYSRLKEYLTVLSRTELLTCSAAQNSFTKIREQAQMLSRDYNVMCCVQYYPVLKQHIRYPFDPCDGDTCTKITCDHGAGSILSREAKRWATKIGKEVKTARESQKKLTYLLQLKDAGNKTDPDDPNGPDLETRIDELREIIRKADTEKAKAEGVIECMRDGDVNVDEWMQDIESLTTTFDLVRSTSSTSIKTDDSREQKPQTELYYDSADDAVSETREIETSSAEPPERDEDIEAQIENERKKIEALSAMTWDDPMKVDWGDHSHDVQEETVDTPPPDVATNKDQRPESWHTDTGAGDVSVVRCVAIYTYTAANPDELSIVENEHLEMIGEGDESGWVRAKNYKGEEGYVPQNYVEIEGEGEGNTSSSGFPLQPQISFSSVDYHVQEATVPMDTTSEAIRDTVPKSNGMPNGYLDQNEDENQNLPQLEGTPTVPTSVSSGLTTPFINEYRHGDVGDCCRALYDYEATAPEELSFYEGQLIKILRRDDDGWWEGEYDGMTGVFPEIVVEECRWDGEPLSPMGEDDEEEDEEVSESGIQPPCYTPPEIPSHLLPPEKVVVTQPTPEIEHPSAQSQLESDKGKNEEPEETEENASGFEMELSGDKQQQYQAHLSDSVEPEPTVNEMPDIMVTMEPDQPEIAEEDQDGGGLDVAQIVITAATPMSEDHHPFPGEEVAKEKEDTEEQATTEISEKQPEKVEPTITNKEIKTIENVISEKENTETAEDEVIESDPNNFDTDDSIELPDGCQTIAIQFEKCGDFKAKPLESEKEKAPEETGWAAFSDDFMPKEPISTVPRVVEVEIKDPSVSKIEPKKSSLEIEDREKAKISLGESNESPVTPEELDVQNLAKLESLKESDA